LKDGEMLKEKKDNKDALEIINALRELGNHIEACEILEKSGLLHPNVIRSYGILSRISDAIPQMEITRRLCMDQGGVAEKQDIVHHHVYTSRTVKKLEEAGVVKTYEGTIQHPTGGARVKFVELVYR